MQPLENKGFSKVTVTKANTSAQTSTSSTAREAEKARALAALKNTALRTRATKKFWQTPEFKAKAQAAGFNPPASSVSVPKTEVTKPRTTWDSSFTRGSSVFYDEENQKYTPDTSKTPVYLVTNPSIPSDSRVVRGQGDAYQQSVKSGFIVKPMVFDTTTEAFFQSLGSDYSQSSAVSLYSNDLSDTAKMNLFNPKYEALEQIDKEKVSQMTQEEWDSLLKDYESKGYVIKSYASMTQEERRSAQGVTPKTDANIVAFKKLLPDEWYVMQRTGVSSADENTWWTENPETGELEPTKFITHLSTKLIDMQNVPNTPFGIAADVTSLRSPMLWAATKSAGFGLLRSVTVDPVLAGVKTLITQNPYSTFYRLFTGKDMWLKSNTEMWKNIGMNIQKYMSELNKPSGGSDPQFTNFAVQQSMMMATGSFDPAVRQSAQNTLAQTQQESVNWQKQLVVDATTYRQQALVALSAGDGEGAVQFTIKAIQADRNLGKVGGDTSTFGDAYAKLSFGVYEDWTWSIMPERETAFIRNLAYAELQKGEPLNVYEVVTIKNKYVDNVLNIAGDVIFDPTGPLLNLPGIVDGIPMLLSKGMKDVANIPVSVASVASKTTGTAAQYMGIMGETKAGTTLGEVLKPLVDATFQVNIKPEFIDKINLRRSVNITSDNPPELLSRNIGKLGVISFLQAGVQARSIVSSSNRLSQNIFKTLRPLVDSLTVGVYNQGNLDLSSLLAKVAKYVDSRESIDAAILAGDLPYIPEKTRDAFVNLAKVGNVEPERWEDLARQASDNVYNRTQDRVVRTLLREMDNVNTKNPAIIEINKKWLALRDDFNAFSKFAKSHLRAEVVKEMQLNKTLKTKSEALKAILERGEADVEKLLKDRFIRANIQDESAFAAFNTMHWAPTAIAFEFGEVARRAWLNQPGITKLIDGSDIPTDTLIGMLDTGKFTQSLLWKYTKEANKIEAQPLRKALLKARSTWQNINQAIFSAVLSGRPGFLVTNYIDSNFRAAIFGVNLTDSFMEILEYHSRRGGLPPALLQSLSKDIITDPDSLAYRIINGQFDVRKLQGLNWIDLFKYNRDMVKSEVLMERAALAERVAGEGKSVLAVNKAWQELRNFVENPVKMFIKTNTEFNNLTEIVARTRTYHHYYMQNLVRTNDAFLQKALQNVADEDKPLVQALIEQSKNNPTKLMESIKRINGSILYSQWIPPQVQDFLNKMEPSQALYYSGFILDQLEGIVASHFDMPNAQVADLVEDFFNKTSDKLKEITDAALKAQSEIKNVGLDALEVPNVTDAIKELGLFGDAPTKRIPTPKMYDTQKIIEESAIGMDKMKQRKDLLTILNGVIFEKVEVGKPPKLLTKSMRNRLLTLGYTDAQITKMKVEEAWNILKPKTKFIHNVSNSEIHKLLNQMLKTMEDNGVDISGLYAKDFMELRETYRNWMASITDETFVEYTDDEIRKILKEEKWRVSAEDADKSPREILKNAIDSANKPAKSTPLPTRVSDDTHIDKLPEEQQVFLGHDADFDSERISLEYDGFRTNMGQDYDDALTRQVSENSKLSDNKVLVKDEQLRQKITDTQSMHLQLTSNLRKFVFYTPGMIDWPKHSGAVRSEMWAWASAWYTELRNQMYYAYKALNDEILQTGTKAEPFSLTKFLNNAGFEWTMKNDMIYELRLKTTGFRTCRIREQNLINQFRAAVFGSVNPLLTDKEALLAGYQKVATSIESGAPKLHSLPDFAYEFTGEALYNSVMPTIMAAKGKLDYEKLIKLALESYKFTKLPGVGKILDVLKVIVRQSDSLLASEVEAAKTLEEAAEIIAKESPSALWEFVATVGNAISSTYAPRAIKNAASDIRKMVRSALRQSGYSRNAIETTMKYTEEVAKVQAEIAGMTVEEWWVNKIGLVTPKFYNLKPMLFIRDTGERGFSSPIANIIERYMLDDSYTGKQLEKLLKEHDITNNIYLNTRYMQDKLLELGDNTISKDEFIDFVIKQEIIPDNMARFDSPLYMMLDNGKSIKTGIEIYDGPKFILDDSAMHYTKVEGGITSNGFFLILPDGQIVKADKHSYAATEIARKNPVLTSNGKVIGDNSPLGQLHRLGGIRIRLEDEKIYIEVHDLTNKNLERLQALFANKVIPSRSQVVMDVTPSMNMRPEISTTISFEHFMWASSKQDILNVNKFNTWSLSQKSRGTVLGAASFVSDGRAIIEVLTCSGLKEQTPANFVHELAHVILPDIPNSDFNTLAKWAVENGLVSHKINKARFTDLHAQMIAGTIGRGEEEFKLYQEYQEAFANGWTKHFIEGNDLPETVVTLFDKIKKAITDFYLRYIKGTSLDVQLNKSMRDMYARLSGLKGSTPIQGPRGTKWKTIVSKNQLNLYHTLDISNPDACIESLKRMISSAETETIADVWSGILHSIERDLNLLPEDPVDGVTEPVLEKFARIESEPTEKLIEGLKHYVEYSQNAVRQLYDTYELLKVWKDHVVEGLRNPESIPDSKWFFDNPTNELKDRLNDVIPDIAKEMEDRNFAVINGGKYDGQKIEGALNKSNEIMIDYTDRYVWEQLPRTIYPFWQFPSRSIPFWVKTLASNTDILNYYNKYLLTSYRQRMQGGMVNSEGEPLKSLAGYVRIPGTDYWFNPTAPLSFRILFPSVYSTKDQTDDDQTEVSPITAVIRSVIDQTRMRGVSLDPTLNIIFKIAGISDDTETTSSIFPQLDLVPRQAQRWLSAGIRRLIPHFPEQWSPEVSYKDALIEQLMLKDAYSQGQAIKSEYGDSPETTQQLFDLYASISMVLGKSPKDRRSDPLWAKYRNQYENSTLARTWAGFMTSFYTKKYTSADAQWNQLRNDMNILKSAMNNDVNRELFTVYKTPVEVTNSYREKRYNSPEGLLYGLKQMTSWVKDANGEELTGDERIQKISDEVNSNELLSSYYDKLQDIYERRNARLSALPIGSPSKIKSVIYEDCAREVAELDGNPMFAPVKDQINGTFSVNNKAADVLYTDFERKWWSLVVSSEPYYDPDVMTYDEWKQRHNEWLKDLPTIAESIAPVFVEDIAQQAEALFPGIQLPAGELSRAVNNNGVDPSLTGFVPELVNMLQKSTTEVGYTEYKKSNDTALDALMSAWMETYGRKYYDAVSGKTNEAREYAERQFRQQYPTSPSDEDLIAWVLDNYPQGKFTVEELRTAASGSGEDALTVDEAQKSGQTEKDSVKEEIYSILNMIGPGNNYSSFLNNYINPDIGGGTEEDLDNFYDSSESMALTDLHDMLDKLQSTASYMGVVDPSDSELVTRALAREQNVEFKETVTSIMGADWYNRMNYVFSLSSSDRRELFKTNTTLQSQFDKYDLLKENYASTHPIWAKYYSATSEESTTKTGTTSGGTSTGGTGTSSTTKGTSKKKSTSRAKEKSLVGTPWQYDVPYDMVRMGNRSTLNANKLLGLTSLGKGGVGGVPQWPKEMVRELEFKVWVASWPTEIKDAMGDVLISALKDKYIWGTGLSDSAKNFIDALAENHPEWKATLQEIVTTQ